LVPIFITGIGTGIGKTVVSAILAEALQSDYWKPVQAGDTGGTDSEWVKTVISNNKSRIHAEPYIFKLAVSPHIAAKAEGREISIQNIFNEYLRIMKNRQQTVTSGIIIEGAGGLLVPLNENEFVIDLIEKLNARVILVSRNYLGSINHSLLSAQVCKERNINVIGWIFNDQYLHYEDEICNWSGYRKIASIPRLEMINKDCIAAQAIRMKDNLVSII
jgi:dethiobiotin synthetase